MFKDFKAFIMRGNVVDLAVGLMIGAAFGAIVKSLVDDVLMPVIGLAVGGIDFSNDFILLKDGPKSPAPYHSLIDARAAGAVTMNYGSFINTLLTFLIVAASVFMVVKAVTKFYPTPAAPVNKKDCPYCKMNIPLAATRCPDCTSQLAPG